MSQFCDVDSMAWKIKSVTLSETSNRTIVLDWFEAQDEDVQNAFLMRMKFLLTLPPSAWDRPYVGQLTRNCKGLFEIRLKVNKVQYRPIGYFSGAEEFTFLAFATERDRKFDPVNICETAFNRKALIEARKERAREITF